MSKRNNGSVEMHVDEFGNAAEVEYDMNSFTGEDIVSEEIQSGSVPVLVTNAEALPESTKAAKSDKGLMRGLLRATVMEVVTFYTRQMNQECVELDEIIGVIYGLDLDVTDSEIRAAVRSNVKLQRLNELSKNCFFLSERSQKIEAAIDALKKTRNQKTQS